MTEQAEQKTGDQQIGDAVLDHVGGGYYDVSHPNLAEKRRVRGIESATELANSLNDAQGGDTAPSDGAGDDGAMEAQGEMPRTVPTATVKVEGDAPPPPPPGSTVPGGVPQRFEGELGKKDKAKLKKAGLSYSKIILEESEEIPPTGLFLSHNGRAYIIVPGQEVDVPDFILGVLEDAQVSTPIVDSKTRRVVGYRDRMKYHFRRLD